MFSNSGSIFNKNYKAKFFQVFIFATVIFSTVTAFAMPGNFDRSFGSRGKAKTSFGTASDKIFAIALQTDGKIVAAGASNDNSINAALVRYNTDGTLDESFGNRGKILLEINGSSEIAYDVKIQSDGKIIIAGTKTSASGDSDFFLARFNTDGSLDNGFGTNGIVFTNAGTAGDIIKSIALQNVNGEEKIVAAGSMGSLSNANFVIARYNTNGTLDESFALGSGITFISWGNEDRAEAVAIQNIGGEEKIVVGGKRRLDFGNGIYNDDFALTRLNANGTMDPTFGNNGKVNTSFAASDIIRDIVIQKIGNSQKIVAGGLGNNNFALTRYNEDGSLDSTFGSQGKVQTSFSTREDQIHDLFLLPDGRILAGGFTRDETGREDFALVRYLQNGQIDLLFGNCGALTSRIGNPYSIIYGVAVQPEDGNTIAAGYAQNGENSDDFTVVRYIDNSGAAPTGLDFDGDGRTDTAVFRPSDGVWHMNRSCQGYNAVKFGQQGDKPVPADYDGDGKTDLAVYREGVWYVQQSTEGFYAVQFGISTDIPTAGDFDDDGKADIAVFRPSNGVWYIIQSSDNEIISTKWGVGGDLPVAADYDGDFKTDLAVFRSLQGTWYVRRSSDKTMQAVGFGLYGDRPLVTDFDGDSLADFTVFRLTEKTWYTQKSSGGFSALQFGNPTDMPITGDYDGDGKTDHSVYRNGTWYMQQSKAGFKAIQFGLADDIPLTSR